MAALRRENRIIGIRIYVHLPEWVLLAARGIFLSQKKFRGD